MPSGFLDLFSAHAAAYAAARPDYPDALYRFVVPLAPSRGMAWDCATGNGQAARDLVRHVGRVVATDASAAQIAHATATPGVTYAVATAEASPLRDRSVGLVTVAQALHWLDQERFYEEVRRVTVPGGVIAAWSYGACAAGSDVEGLLREFEHGIVGAFWHPGRRWVDEGYRTIPFSFPEVPAPTFVLRARWNLHQLGGYLSSWSAVAAYRRERGEDPVPRVLEAMAQYWGPAGQAREVTWPLALRVGRIE